jgi:hypothetical protein
MDTKLGVSLLIKDAVSFLNFINCNKYVTNALNSLFRKLINQIYEFGNINTSTYNLIMLEKKMKIVGKMTGIVYGQFNTQISVKYTKYFSTSLKF